MKNTSEIEYPLIAVVLITYNASKTIENTLDSIKNQTYKNIELIISDDCSIDNTLDICRQYITLNIDVDFIRNARIISTPTNSGITPNYNNALKYISSDWIKYIADDELKPFCLAEYVNFIRNHEERLIVSGVTPFNDMMEMNDKIPNPAWLKGNANKQLKSLLKRGTFIPGPTLFVHKNTLLAMNGFDENYPFIEDYPLFINFTKNGYRIGLINNSLVRWRDLETSVSNSSAKFEQSIYAFFWDIVYPEMKKQKLYFYYWHYFLNKSVILKKYPLWIKRVMYLIDPVGLYLNLKRKH